MLENDTSILCIDPILCKFVSPIDNSAEYRCSAVCNDFIVKTDDLGDSLYNSVEHCVDNCASFDE